MWYGCWSDRNCWSGISTHNHLWDLQRMFWKRNVIQWAAGLLIAKTRWEWSDWWRNRNSNRIIVTRKVTLFYSLKYQDMKKIILSRSSNIRWRLRQSCYPSHAVDIVHFPNVLNTDLTLCQVLSFSLWSLYCLFSDIESVAFLCPYSCVCDSIIMHTLQGCLLKSICFFAAGRPPWPFNKTFLACPSLAAILTVNLVS